MTSWISHLPPELEFAEVHGLGMNHQELQENQALTAGVQHDLNEDPKLPYADNYFDSVLCAVSVQYLTRPVEVFREVGRILKPDGRFFVSFSHRMFPTKAVEVWKQLGPEDRSRLVGSYFSLSQAFGDPSLIDRSPEAADPLWIVTAAKS
ncbi:MAG: class I SAM-dependent methyltransferase [Dehalococcoidia bacterium]|jgi:SAM-dependent methyltransferase|nr:class I SAM-dependent methyltransferase [Dehalococcoidia bacterium]|tara:strand:+ start:3729 stop:4178 length:450 start_codon:yes stop_codon:yes gene_type:complete